MVQCTKCGNETRTAALLVPMGEVLVSGPGGSEPLPISAQVCVACGHIDLYAPQSFEQPQRQRAAQEETAPVEELAPAPGAPTTTA
jgi:Zn ribbon nucleic-acid-binding protein